MNKQFIGITVATIIGICVIIAAAGIFFVSSPNTQNDTLKVTFISNSGFIIQVNDKIVLIDGIFSFSQFSQYFEAPSTAELGQLVYGKSPFDKIDLIIATHSDGDHFDPDLMETFLRYHPKTPMILTNTTSSLLNATHPSTYDQIQPQLFPVSFSLNTSWNFVINDIGVKIFSLRHPASCGTVVTNGTTEIIENLGVLLTIGDVKIFHCGDSDYNFEADYAYYKLYTEDIDVAIIPGYWFGWQDIANQSITNDQGIAFIKTYIKPQKVIFMHFLKTALPFYLELKETIKNEFTSITVFQQSLESKILS